MKITILLQSATGNTRLVARYAAAALARAGHELELLDIARQPVPPLDDVELLGVACPTMYFRPAFAMEQALEALPDGLGRARPAFLLGTAGGEPGAHFEILARLLARKGFRALAACWVIFPDSWPPHHHAVRGLAPLAPLAAALARVGPRSLRSLLGIAWPALGDPDAEDRARLDRFLAEVLARAQAGRIDEAPAPEALHRAALFLDAAGRRIRRELIEPYSRPRFDAQRCDGCGTCVSVCPAHIIVQREEKAVPTVGHGCTGCFACYNLCPTGAISAWASPGGEAQYRGPSRAARAIFRRDAGGED